HVSRPAMTAGWLAELAGATAEFNVLCEFLRAAVTDSSVLDVDPATDKAMGAFRRVTPPTFSDPIGARASDVACRQLFLARRLFTVAGDIVDDAAADIDAAGRATAVGCVLVQLGAWQCAIPKAVADEMPSEEWQELRDARVFAMTNAQR